MGGSGRPRRPTDRRRQGLRHRRHRGPRARRRDRRPPGRPLHRGHGPVRLRQEHADALPRRPRHAHRRPASSSATPSSARCRDRELTRVRRERIGFVFQAFNLLPDAVAPTRTSRCRWTSPAASPTASGCAQVDRHRRPGRPPASTDRASSPAASSSASPWPGRWPSSPTLVFADEPTGNLDRRSGTEILSFMRKAVDTLGQTIVMVTHDPVAASYADTRAVPRRRPDRRLDGQPHRPTAVLDRMKALGD